MRSKIFLPIIMISLFIISHLICSITVEDHFITNPAVNSDFKDHNGFEIDIKSAKTRVNENKTSVLINTDWYIDSSWQITNVSYLLRGNLTINNTGTLNLINTTIIFDPNENMRYGLYIKPNGKLTTDENTVIKVKSTDSKSNSAIIHAYKNSQIFLKKTIIQLGFSDVNEELVSGLIIETDHNSIDQCVFSNSNYGVHFLNTINNNLNNSLFSNISDVAVKAVNSSGLEFNNLNISDSTVGIEINNSDDIWITYSSFNKNNFVLKVSNSNQLNFIAFTIINSTGGMKFENSSGSLHYFQTGDDVQIILNNNTNLAVESLWPFPERPSSFRNTYTIDNSSELHVYQNIQFRILQPMGFSYPQSGNFTIYDSSGNTYYIAEIDGKYHIVDFEPLSIVKNITYWHDPYRIEFFSGGYLLNETFSIINNISFNFQLKFNNAPVLKSARVTPDSGDTKTSFVFYVEYFDLDEDEPEYVALVLSGERYLMMPFFDNATASEGIQYKTEFFNLEPGSHDYYFETDDGGNYSNSKVVLRGIEPLEILKSKKSSSDSDAGDTAVVFFYICSTMLIVMIVFIIVLNYFMQKKMDEVGGIEPGTLPEDIPGFVTEDKVVCSECGAEIEGKSEACPKCGLEFNGEEFQCPKCQKRIPEDVDICPHCGNRFLELDEGMKEEEEEESERAGEEERKRVGEGESEDDAPKSYCSVCGASVKSDLNKCPKCGTEFE